MDLDATGSFSFRAVAVEDFPLLREWHRRPEVLMWWPDPPTEQALQHYCAAVPGRASRFCIALLDGAPVGFIQSYRPVDGHDEGWWRDEHDLGVHGIDQFLANSHQLNLGLGTRMIQAFVAMLLEDPAVTRIPTDPDPGNGRAIRCYEKAGFQRSREVATPDGSALLLYLDRAKAL